MLKDFFILVLEFFLSRLSPEKYTKPAGEPTAPTPDEQAQRIKDLEEDYEVLAGEYQMLTQRIREEGSYLDETGEVLCMKLYRILAEEKKLPLTFEEIQEVRQFEEAQPDVVVTELQEVMIEEPGKEPVIKQKKIVRRKEDDYVYIIKANHRNRYKIGSTNAPERRAGQLRTGSPEPLQHQGWWPGGERMERFLHQRLAIYRVFPNLEWFDLPDDIFEQLVESLNAGTANSFKVESAETKAA